MGYKKKINVLIDNGISRGGLAVARGLKLHDCYSVHIVTHQRSKAIDFVQGTFRSKAYDRVHFIEPYADSAHIGSLVKIIKESNIDVLIPIATDCTLVISKNKAELSKYCKVPVEDYEKMEKFHDKGKTMQMAAEWSIPHPKTIFPKDLEEVEAFSKNAAYPVVVKARKGYASKGVCYANNKEEMLNLYREMDEKSAGDGFIIDQSSPMIQEFIPGILHDVTSFSVDGEMKAGLSQKRTVTTPIAGGGGVVNVTTYNEELLGYARQFIKKTNWNGILEFDFKMDERYNTPKLLEINPKFWGTTWLTISAGFNYPHYLVQHAIGNELDIPDEYKVGLTCRWPDGEWDAVTEKPLTLSVFLKRFAEFIKRFRQPDTVYAIQLLDLKPFIGNILIFFVKRMKIFSDT